MDALDSDQSHIESGVSLALLASLTIGVLAFLLLSLAAGGQIFVRQKFVPRPAETKSSLVWSTSLQAKPLVVYLVASEQQADTVREEQAGISSNDFTILVAREGGFYRDALGEMTGVGTAFGVIDLRMTGS